MSIFILSFHQSKGLCKAILLRWLKSSLYLAIVVTEMTSKAKFSSQRLENTLKLA